MVHAEQRLQRLQQALTEARSAVETLQPEEVMRKLEEDIQIHSYLANEKLPKEIEAKRAIVHDLAKVASQPALDQSDIEQIKKMVNLRFLRACFMKNIDTYFSENMMLDGCKREQQMTILHVRITQIFNSYRNSPQIPRYCILCIIFDRWKRQTKK